MENEIAQRAFNCANSKGFYDDYRRVMAALSNKEDRDFLARIWRSHRLMLIVSELAEGLEAVRDDNMSTEPKSGGLGEELADARVRLEDLYVHLYGTSSDAAVLAKIAYNESRPPKHGRSGGL